MAIILAVDIGGTKTLFQLSNDQGDVLFEQRLISADFAHFDLALAAFLNQDQLKDYQIDSACFAVAGPVSGRDASVTNLPWQLNADSLAVKFNIAVVTLCNDFAAVAYGIAGLEDKDILTLQHGDEKKTAPRAVIGAGTGLGQAVLVNNEQGWQVLATEGGHTNFAPTDQQQIALLSHLMIKYEQVSYERLVSGVGIKDIYEFLLLDQKHTVSDALQEALKVGDTAAVISEFAREYDDALAQATMALFISVYGSQAGNLALTVLPMAGLYIAGRIAVKNKHLFEQGLFMTAFNAKGKMAGLMTTIPVRSILNEQIGLVGARLLAVKNNNE